jgi:isopentenyl diphosphate isomerase/L-lactate dehydrogenase-like FMN-dependent dehydrogenase
MGASAVGIGRPYCFGLGAFGQAGVERVLDLLNRELLITMRGSGTPTIASIVPNYVQDIGYRGLVPG